MHAVQPRHVEQHVDRDHEDQHEVEERPCRSRSRRPRRTSTTWSVYLPTSRSRMRRTRRWPLSSTLIDSRWCVVRASAGADRRRGRPPSGVCPLVVEIVVEPLRRGLRLPHDDGPDRDDDHDHNRRKRRVHERDREAAADPHPPERRARSGRAAARSAPRQEEEHGVTRRRSPAPSRTGCSSGSPTSWIQRGIWIRGGAPAGAFTQSIVLPGRGATRRALRHWDWSLAEDGALALDRAGRPGTTRARLCIRRRAVTRLKARRAVRYGPADVAAPGLRARRASACPSPSARSAAASACRARRAAGVVIALTVLVTAFGGGGGSGGRAA